MIGVDTNILTRYIVRDDQNQVVKADRLLDALTPEDPAFVSDIVLCELVWVLRRSYRLGRTAICDILERVLATRGLLFSDRSLVVAALMAYRNGQADFADCLIGLLNHAAGCDATLTFDMHAAALPQFRVL